MPFQKPFHSPPPVRSIEAEHYTIGAASRLFYTSTDTLGRLIYRIGKREEHVFDFGQERAEQDWAVIDQVLIAALFRPPDSRLAGLASFHSDRIFLMAEDWGRAIHSRGEGPALSDPLREMRREQLPVIFAEDPDWVGIRFAMNIHFREMFSSECLERIQPDHLNTLEIFFRTPSGDFAEARLVVQNKMTQRVLRTATLHQFPLTWVECPFWQAEGGAASESPGGVAEGNPFSAPGRPTRTRMESLPETQSLSDSDLMLFLREESDPERLWMHIERNLLLQSIGRTYRILSCFADLVGERTIHWPADRLYATFAGQPGALLIPLLSASPVDVVLRFAEGNPQRDYLLDWLQEREVERLLQTGPSNPPASAAEARAFLNISADASPREVKKVWRCQLRFLSGDFGRQVEQALHRKKDEIAKRLQQARDLLVR